MAKEQPGPEEWTATLQKVAAHDPDAIDLWYRTEYRVVWRLCLGFLADENDADDAAQDAMLMLLDQMSRFDRSRPWARWRNTVVLNHCRDRLRRKLRRLRSERSAEPSGLGALPDPHAEAERSELASAVVQSLRFLSPREREVIVLHDLEGLETLEVAGAMDVGESTVRSLLTLARRRLRQLLSERLPQTCSGEAETRR